MWWVSVGVVYHQSPCSHRSVVLAVVCTTQITTGHVAVSVASVTGVSGITANLHATLLSTERSTQSVTIS